MVSLLVPIEAAKSRVASRIDEGNQLSEMRITTAEELEEAQSLRSIWSGRNEEMLKHMFDDDSIAKEYIGNLMGGVFHRYLSDRIDDFRRNMRFSITRLRTIQGKLDEITALPKANEEPAGRDSPEESRDGSRTALSNPLQIVELLCTKFAHVAKQLQNRHGGRMGFIIEDEYDVQDLLHGLLMLFFGDIRTEEWTPSYAGRSSRMDFLLKRESMVIETKKAGPQLGEKQIGEQLLVDIERYKKRTDCKKLVCMIYDPGSYVKNPRGLEDDLSREEDDLLVKVFVTPRWF